MASERPPPPSDRFSTRAPWSTAQRIPSAMACEVPLPDADSTFTGMSRACGAIPATPLPLPVLCATVPETCVPWAWSSRASSLLATKFHPFTRRAGSRSSTG